MNTLSILRAINPLDLRGSWKTTMCGIGAMLARDADIRFAIPMMNGATNDVLQIPETKFVIQDNQATNATPLQLRYGGSLVNVGVTNINGAAVLYLMGVIP